jgi:phage terminase small subunit
VTKRTATRAEKRKRTAVKDPETGLTQKALRFAREYLVDLNATQAAIRAGYSEKTAYSIGQELLKKPEIAALVQEGQAKRAMRTQVTVDRVLEEAARIAFVDIRDFYDDQGRLKDPKTWSEHQAAAVASIESFEEYTGRGEDREAIGMARKIKLWDKRAQLETLFKHLGMLKERVEVSGKLTITRKVIRATRSAGAASADADA